MEKDIAAGFEQYFGELPDPRVERKILYPLQEVLFVVLCGVICGAESWREFVLFGKEKLDFLREYFPFEFGIPCKNTFARVCGAIDPEKFRVCFLKWVSSLQKGLKEGIAIDGKTLCNSADVSKDVPSIHMVSAFGTESKLVLGQEKVAHKSNEITAIPALLDVLDIKGHTITIDAMGCQKAIARKIQDQGGEYVLALKGNQGTLNEEVRLFLETELAKPVSTALSDTHVEADKGHGRVETRKCVVSHQIDWLAQKSEWSGFKTIAMIEETREIKGRASTERRFFISSLPADAKQIAHAVRAHWLVENTLHWTLDVVFNEDKSTVRKDHAPQNMAIVRHLVLNLLNNAKQHFKKGTSLKGLRKSAGWVSTANNLNGDWSEIDQVA